MRNKKTLAVLIVACLAIASVSAATNDVRFRTSLYPRTTHMGVTVTSANGNSSSSFKFSLGGDLAVLFKSDFGLYFALDTELTGGSFGIVAGGAYFAKLNNDVDMLATVGPSFVFSNNSTEIGADVFVNFDFKMSQSMFFRVGTGLDMTFWKVWDGGSDNTFRMYIPIPAFAIGWKF